MSIRGTERRSYRVCWIGRAGAIDAVTDPFLARSDADAILQAAVMADGDQVQLWSGSRLIMKFEASTLRRSIH